MENWQLVSIAAEAPTLRDLQSLPAWKQGQLLLRRLATQYPNSSLTFGKMNLDLPALASDLASGYPRHEVMAVKDLLLGAPWKKLESDGFIRDDGRGWFRITPEGFEAAHHAEAVFAHQEIMSALGLLYSDFQDYGHYFHENKLKEAVAGAFERYENRLNEIRDTSRKGAVKGVAGPGLVHKLFAEKVLKRPYKKLGRTTTAREAYEQGLTGVLSGGVSWIRNAYTHEKHNLPDLTPTEALELLFVASYFMRMLNLAKR